MKSPVNSITPFCTSVGYNAATAHPVSIEKLNGRNDHVTMFNLHLPLAVFSLLVIFSSFVLASKARIT